MRTYLANIDWNNLLKNKTATECWICLKYETEGIIEKLFQLRKQGKSPGRKKFHKHMQWRIYKHTGTGNVEDYTNYKEALNLATTEIRKSKRTFETPLAKVFNLSLEEGTVPSEWKEANITRLFKKGSRNKPENYRPVSLTSVVCKLLEILIRDHMVEFLVKHKLINTSQHGFLSARSCLTNLFVFWKKLQSG